MDQSLEPLGVSFAQYRALEGIDLNREMHISELARFLRLSRQATQMIVHKLDEGGLVDLIPEAGRVYVRSSELGLRRLRLLRGFTRDLKVRLEEQLNDGERHRLTELIRRADDALEKPKPDQPEWWLAP